MVREQIRVAQGEELSFTQDDVSFSGHAIECRSNAQNSATSTPPPGPIQTYHAPGGLGLRMDSAIYSGYAIPPYYDSLIGKLIVHAETREACLMRLERALGEFAIDGVETTIPLFEKLLPNEDFRKADYDIHWLEVFLGMKEAD